MRASLDGLTFHVLDPGAVLEAHRPGEFVLFRIGRAHLGLLQSKTTGLHLEVGTPDVDDLHAALVAAGSIPRALRVARRGPSERSTFGTLTET